MAAQCVFRQSWRFLIENLNAETDVRRWRRRSKLNLCNFIWHYLGYSSSELWAFAFTAIEHLRCLVSIWQSLHCINQTIEFVHRVSLSLCLTLSRSPTVCSAHCVGTFSVYLSGEAAAPIYELKYVIGYLRLFGIICIGILFLFLGETHRPTTLRDHKHLGIGRTNSFRKCFFFAFFRLQIPILF